MEVPQRPEPSIRTSNSEPNSIISNSSILSISNQPNSTEYVVPSMRYNSQQQQQLLLVNKNVLKFN